MGDHGRRHTSALLGTVVLLPLATVALAGWSSATASTGGEASDREAVRRIYLGQCATCHGSEGEGTSQAPSLVGDGRASTFYWLSTGRMPIEDPDEDPERGAAAYPPDVVAALVDYVAEITGDETSASPEVEVADGDLAAGGQIFRLQCAACHAWSGAGGALFRREAPATPPATPLETAAAIRAGPGDMPAFGEAAIPEDELDDVVAYVEFLDDPENRGGLPLWYLGPIPEGAVAITAGVGLLVLATRWVGERGT